MLARSGAAELMGTPFVFSMVVALCAAAAERKSAYLLTNPGGGARTHGNGGNGGAGVGGGVDGGGRGARSRQSRSSFERESASSTPAGSRPGTSHKPSYDDDVIGAAVSAAAVAVLPSLSPAGGASPRGSMDHEGEGGNGGKGGGRFSRVRNAAGRVARESRDRMDRDNNNGLLKGGGGGGGDADADAELGGSSWAYDDVGGAGAAGGGDTVPFSDKASLFQVGARARARTRERASASASASERESACD